MLITLKELSQLLSMKEDTLRLYLGNYRFNKFIVNKEIYICKEFIKELQIYLQLKSSVSSSARKVLRNNKLSLLIRFTKE